MPEADAVKVPVAGSIVPHFGEGVRVEALAPDYRRIVELVESGPQGGEGVSAKEIASGLGLELVPTVTQDWNNRTSWHSSGRKPDLPRGPVLMHPPGRDHPAKGHVRSEPAS